MSEYQFKPGERVLVEASYCDCYEESAWVGTLYEDAMPYEGTSMNVARRHIHPLPSDGEYLLTVDELIDFALDYEEAWCERGGFLRKDSREFVKQWLERKEKA